MLALQEGTMRQIGDLQGSFVMQPVPARGGKSFSYPDDKVVVIPEGVIGYSTEEAKEELTSESLAARREQFLAKGVMMSGPEAG